MVAMVTCSSSLGPMLRKWYPHDNWPQLVLLILMINLYRIIIHNTIGYNYINTINTLQ